MIISLSVPVGQPDGNWTWGTLPRYTGEIAREYVYSAAECLSALRTYGRSLASILRLIDGDRYQVSAREIRTGVLAGRAEWIWSPLAGMYVPNGEPWSNWPGVRSAYWRTFGSLLSAERFRAVAPIYVVPGSIRCAPAAIRVAAAA
ncbi:hypothetical protein [Streptomyces albidoflavus]|uniref:hypothetical protein n=1 Tax=Streptomyces albidoflavus TaxID=1886 RepID=UPI0004C63B3E|nr:hypothetical protein [Streptomyces albidoflavus]